MSDPISFDRNPMFNGLNKKQLEALDSIASEMVVKAGDFLMKEGDTALDMYFIVHGSLEVIKNDAEHGGNYVIGILRDGDTIGELSLLDRGMRSASVKALSDSTLKRLSFKDLEKLGEVDIQLYKSLFHHLSQNISYKLRQTNVTAADALKHQLEEYQNRVYMGQLFIYLIVVLSIIIYSIRFVSYEFQHAENSTNVSIPIIVCLTVFVFLMMRSSRLPMEMFGFTLKNWKRSVIEGIALSIPIMGLSLAIKYFLIHFVPFYGQHQLFNPFAMVNDTSLNTLSYWLKINASYALFVPAQELMARGSLQGLLEKFLVGKHRVLTSIIISNLIFSTCHVYLSEWVAVIAFTGGLFLGWLYSRTHNLIGVIICHIIVGTWTLGILGP